MRSATLSAAVAALAAALGATATLARAQTPAPESREESACLGFAFGRFTPALDWAKAGHRPIRDRSTIQHAPDGRDWASNDGLPNDSLLYLFPSWWPVGVLVELPGRPHAARDTVVGRATALVARGDVTPPVAVVKAWRVPCGRAAPTMRPTTPPTAPAPDDAAQRPRQNR